MTVDPVQKLNRELGDWTLIFIILTLTVRPAHELISPKLGLNRYRRMLGLFAYFYAILHLSSYVGIDLQFSWDKFYEEIIKRKFIVIGVIAVGLITPLAITSNKRAIKRLGNKLWKKLHLLIYPAAVLGVIHFFMMVRAEFYRPLLYSAIIVFLLGYRMWKFYFVRK
ncbi:MAG: protein-methionine-sulfoxide reductase heme-binding subunit MsrQ [Pseudomonadota bacterium]|nr:protein-methionine-sulfoxide reductase heme-binding subunit MsrQ [Pseudomonadota bacterium]